MANERTGSYILERGNFISSGSRPSAASIKTAIIRPTNYYEQQQHNKRTSDTSPKDNQVSQ